MADLTGPSHSTLLRQYLRDIWDDGVARMGSGLGIFLAFLAVYFAFVLKHNIAALWLLALLAFLFASYRVWVKEHRGMSAEQVKNAKPLIVGHIIEVITEKTISQKYEFDYHFTVNFSLTNQRANTNFQSFEFTLFAENTKNGPAHQAESFPLVGLCLERKEPPSHEKLKNYESEKLLTQWETRRGWLRFVVNELQWDFGKGAPVFTRIQIIVTDGSGQRWPLDSTPPWAETNYNLQIQPCNQVWFA